MPATRSSIGSLRSGRSYQSSPIVSRPISRMRRTIRRLPSTPINNSDEELSPNSRRTRQLIRQSRSRAPIFEPPPVPNRNRRPPIDRYPVNPIRSHT